MVFICVVLGTGYLAKLKWNKFQNDIVGCGLCLRHGYMGNFTVCEWLFAARLGHFEENQISFSLLPRHNVFGVKIASAESWIKTSAFDRFYFQILA